MGHSEYDPLAKVRPAWNAGRKVGAKRALKPQQVYKQTGNLRAVQILLGHTKIEARFVISVST